MMKTNQKGTLILPLSMAGLLLLSACTNNPTAMDAQHDHGHTNSAEHTETQESATIETLTGNSFTLTAKQSKLQLDDHMVKDVWTFNGTVPGPQLRVKQGETIKVVLKNELPDPVTIHWHGLPVPNNMDGIPGVTQNAVKPTESFTYEFKVDVPGTYWYHSHQKGVVQVDKGLYGSIVVEPKDAQPTDKDYTLVLDEWTKDDNMGHGGTHGGGHGDHSATNTDEMPMTDAEMMPMMFTIFSANGKSGSAIQPLHVKKGEKVRLRLVNAGFLSHQMYLQGHDFTIVATDGQPIKNPSTIKDQLLNIAPGERYDIEFIADNPGKWLLHEQSDNPGAKSLAIPIIYDGATGNLPAPTTNQMPVLAITAYAGSTQDNPLSLTDKYDVEYTMDLNSEWRNGAWAFTINGKTAPQIPPINVKKGDLVKVKMVNNSAKDLHPMHLHGHFFQVLSKNKKPLSSPLVKDTLNLLPGEEYVVAFRADNAGNWMFHCHDLGHASAGMMTDVKYQGFKPDFTLDPTVENMPE